MEGDTSQGEGKGKCHSSSTWRKKRRLEDSAEPDLTTLVSHLAEVPASIKKQTDLSELTSLSQTLKNLKDVDADHELTASVNARLHQALLANESHPATSSMVPKEVGGVPASQVS